MRVAWWSPMPPQPSGVADYSFELLGALSADLDLVAVVSDDAAGRVRAPAGVEVAGAAQYLSGETERCDLDVYQMGNHPLYRYMYASALDRPGLLVLHDPALVDFYGYICGGADSQLFLSEATYNDPEGAAALGGRYSSYADLPTVLVDGRPTPDRLRLFMSRRLVESSLMTLTHSAWAADELRRRNPAALVATVPQPGLLAGDTRSLEQDDDGAASGASGVFGVFGGIAAHKRIPAVLEAFAKLRADFPSARLTVVGRREEEDAVRALEEAVQAPPLLGAVEVVADASIARLEAEISRSTAAIALRWPTTGETSAVVMRALAAGRPVIVSDVPQYRELDPEFCWSVPTDPEGEAAGLLEQMRSVLADPARCTEAGRAAARFVALNASLAVAADRYASAIGECAPLSRAGSRLWDVSAVGNWRATTGLAEAARRSVSALIEAGVAVSAAEFVVPGVPRAEHRAPEWSFGRQPPLGKGTRLCYLNVNELHVVPDEALRPAGFRGRLIALWFWELSTLPPDLAAQVDRVDEIWVGSRFTAEAFRRYTTRPVLIMPCAVAPVATAGMRRKDFGLPEDACLYLFHFDANSTFARKNPEGVIKAFSRAFDGAERGGPARLVMKTLHLSRHPEARQHLLAALAEVGGILLEDDLTHKEVNSLTALCDVYVSLHRSEGFGLGIAEAMALGRPVVATAYAGNMDYTTQSNSCLVGYRLRPIDESDYRLNPAMAGIYTAGQLWAEPDVDEAARFMRWLFENPAERARLGALGAAAITDRYSSAAASEAMLARLDELEAEESSAGEGGAGLTATPPALAAR